MASHPVRPQLLRTMVHVLKEWAADGCTSAEPWSGMGRLTGIVTIASRPCLVASLAEGTSEIGRLPIAGSVERVCDESHIGLSNSAWRLHSVHEAFDLGLRLLKRLTEYPGPGSCS
jgi:ATP-dependent DNA helicase RecQ